MTAQPKRPTLRDAAQALLDANELVDEVMVHGNKRVNFLSARHNQALREDALRAALAEPERQHPADDALYIAERLCELAEWDDTPADQGDLMHQAAQKLRELSEPALCEGCPQHGQPHVCTTPEQLANWAKHQRVVLCETCGNKRCPHATDPRNACTNSNEPGQPLSPYP